MSSIDRLKVLAQSGDLTAIEELRVEARRRNDPGLAIEAAQCSGDSDALLTITETAWVQGDDAHCIQGTMALGFVLDRNAVERVERILKRAHGKRRARLLSKRDVLEVISRAKRDGYAWAHGGGASHRVTTVALAVRLPDGDLVFGASELKDGCSPADVRGWKRHFKSWEHELFPAEDILQDALLWAADERSDRTQLRGVQISVPTAQPPSPDKRHVEELEATLHQRLPSQEGWRALHRLIQSWPHPASLELALSQCRDGLETWPDNVRSGEGLFRLSYNRPTSPDSLPHTRPLFRRLSLKLPDDFTAEFLASPGLDTLTELRLYGPGDDVAVVKLAHAKRLNQVTTLALQGLGAPALLWFIGSPMLKRVRSLSVRVDPDKHDAVERLLEHCTALRHLEIRGADNLEFLHTRNLPWVEQLESLSCSNTQPTPPSFVETLAKRCPSLTSLELCNPEGFFRKATIYAFSDIAAALEHLPQLTALSLSGGLLTPDEVSSLLQATPRLESLVVSEQPRLQSVAKLKRLAKVVERCAHLKVLRIERSALSGQALQAFFEHLPSTLEILSFNDQPRTDGLDNTMIAPLFEHPGLATLKTLRLGGSWAHSSNITGRALKQLARRTDTQIEWLDFSRSRVGHVGAKALAGWPGLRTTKRLNLSHAGIGPKGRDALKTSPYLRGEVILGPEEGSVERLECWKAKR